MLGAVYSTLPEVDYVICTIANNTDFAPNELFTPAIQSEDANVTVDSTASADFLANTYKISSRESIIPTLAVRRACVEDHDDLVPIFDTQSDVLSEIYGTFFLAELIASETPENPSLVAVKDDRACGLLSLTKDVSVGMLQDCFQLEVYDYLVKLPDGESYDGLETAKQRMDSMVSETGDDLKGLDFVEPTANTPPRIVIAGAPASGKGTQCALLVEKYGVVHLSTGDMLRAAVAVESEVGLQAKEVMEAGELVSDELITKVVLERLAEPDCVERGWMLDGFPRTKAQADAMKAADIVPHVFVVLDVPDEKIVERVTGRRLDPVEGTIYHEPDNMPEDEEVKARLTTRADDTEEKCLLRLATYHENVTAILPCYDGSSEKEEEEGEEEKEGEEKKEEEEEKEDGAPALTVDVAGESTNVLKRVDGDLDKNDVFAAVVLAIDTMLPPPSAASAVAPQPSPVTKQMSKEELLESCEPNAFAVTLFCLDGSLDSRSMDFLPHAFNEFPDRDYCVLTVPTTTSESALLAHFTAVTPKEGSTFSHCLYVLHRDELFAHEHLKVERFTEEHGGCIGRLIRSMGDAGVKMQEEIAKSETESDVGLDENPGSAAFAVSVGSKVVGVVVAHRRTTSVEDINWLRCNYHAEDFVAYDRHRARNQATISCFALSPTYIKQGRFVMKEIMRLYDKTVLYYESPPGEDVPKVIADEFVGVRPRMRAVPKVDELAPMWTREARTEEEKEGGEEKREEEKEEGGVWQPSPATGMSLLFLTKRLLTEPKVTCNTRIVVVGASTAGVTFIETLLYTPYLNFTNITLVSPGGLGMDDDLTGVMPFDEDFPDAGRLVSLGLHHRIKIADSVMCSLDRDAKAIVLGDGSVLPYDALVLASGREDSSVNKVKGAGGDVDGVFFLTNSGSKGVLGACDYLSEGDQVVVYGTGLEVLTCVGGLLEKGVPGEAITLIGGCALGDAVLDDSVKNAMEDVGVRVLDGGVKVTDVVSDGGCLSAVRCLNGLGEESVIECRMCVFGDKRDCNGMIYQSVNDSGLVYDGRLVVGLDFRTVDESIFAGGTLTKFSRAFKSAQKHEFFSSREVGVKLAECVLEKVDPLGEGELLMEAERGVPNFGAPRCVSGKLPGGYWYCRCVLPVVEKGGVSMVTGGLGEGTCGRYSILKVDGTGVVNEFMYLGKEKVEFRNLGMVVGLQEAYLNSCVASYDKGAVEDWVSFFREDWCSSIYHDRFGMLKDGLRSLLKDDEGCFDVTDMLVRGVEEGKDDDTLNTMRKSSVGPGGSMLMPSTKKLIESSTIEFLRKNKALLPRYLLPERGSGN